MADRIIKAVIVGSSAGAVRAFEETSLAADATGTKIGDGIEKGSSKAGGALNKLSNLGASFGLPFTSSLGKIGDKFDQTSTKGQGSPGPTGRRHPTPDRREDKASCRRHHNRP